MTEVTNLLRAIENGDPLAANQLLPMVYDELRKLASHRLSQDRDGVTLQATALVHEAYLRLVGEEDKGDWNSRGHFFGAAAQAMRRIIIDEARRRKSLKRGGAAVRNALGESALEFVRDDQELLAIDDALELLSATDPAAAELVKLRFFVGLTMEEAAQVLAVSVRTAYDLWAYARSWLHHELRAE